MQDKIKKVVEIIKKYQMNDPRTWGLVAFAGIVLAVTWSGAKTIQLNFELQKRSAVIAEQNKVLELENQTQKLKNEYFKTDEYKELSARRLFGKAAPGERVYIIPKEVAMKYATPDPQKQSKEIAENPLKIPPYQQNLQDWLDFFFHRAPNS